jgi:hypothetical protein
MQPYQKRVVEEKSELDTKINDLKKFIADSPFYKSLAAAEQSRLAMQYDSMVTYSRILGERIAAFT